MTQIRQCRFYSLGGSVRNPQGEVNSLDVGNGNIELPKFGNQGDVRSSLSVSFMTLLSVKCTSRPGSSVTSAAGWRIFFAG